MMKASEMTNEELAKALMSRVPLDSNNHDDIREASYRLRKQDITVAAQKEKGAEAKREEESCKQSDTNCNRLGNVAKMREALINAYYAMFKFIKTPYAECDEMAFALDGAIAALAAPPRNCDRPECATTKEAQEVWRKEDGGKTAYYEWLLAKSTKGETK